MLFNYILGLGLAWVFLYLIYRKDRFVIIFIAPFASVVSHTVNSFGYYLGVWAITPVEWGRFAILPYDLGYFVLVPVFYIYLVRRFHYNPYWLLGVFSLILTLAELIAISFGKLFYFQGWNLILTFFSYCISYGGVYWYYV